MLALVSVLKWLAGIAVVGAALVFGAPLITSPPATTETESPGIWDRLQSLRDQSQKKETRCIPGKGPNEPARTPEGIPCTLPSTPARDEGPRTDPSPRGGDVAKGKSSHGCRGVRETINVPGRNTLINRGYRCHMSWQIVVGPITISDQTGGKTKTFETAGPIDFPWHQWSSRTAGAQVFGWFCPVGSVWANDEEGCKETRTASSE